MKKENALYAIAALIVGFVAGHYLIPRQDRFVILNAGSGGQARIIKINRHTGETWRYYRNQDGSEGFTRLTDIP